MAEKHLDNISIHRGDITTSFLRIQSHAQDLFSVLYLSDRQFGCGTCGSTVPFLRLARSSQKLVRGRHADYVMMAAGGL